MVSCYIGDDYSQVDFKVLVYSVYTLNEKNLRQFLSIWIGLQCICHIKKLNLRLKFFLGGTISSNYVLLHFPKISDPTSLGGLHLSF